MPLLHPLSESLEGKEQGKTLNELLSKEKANHGQHKPTLSFTLRLPLRKHVVWS